MIQDPIARANGLYNTLLWLHSKKHDEKNPEGAYHKEWENAARLVYDDMSATGRQLEDIVHPWFGRFD